MPTRNSRLKPPISPATQDSTSLDNHSASLDNLLLDSTNLDSAAVSPSLDDRTTPPDEDRDRTAANSEPVVAAAPKAAAVDIAAQVARWSHQGDVQRRARDFEAAIASYDRALELDAANYWVWYHRGSVLEDLERYEEAVDSYSNAITERPDDYWAWYQRGNCLDHLQRFDAAIESYDRAIELRPEDYWAWYRRANVLRHAERNAEAVASYDRALELRPGDFWGWYRRGQALLEARHYNEAVNSFQEALTLRPQQANVWYALASCYAHQRLVEQAIACLREALQWGDEDYRDKAAGDAHFSSIRRRKPFQAFLKEPELAAEVAEAIAASASETGDNGMMAATANGYSAADAIAVDSDDETV